MEAVREQAADVSVIFVPAPFAADAIMEAADAGVDLAVCITEGIPTMDMMKAFEYLSDRKTRVIGPQLSGIISPGKCKIGIMPGFIHNQGRIGVISRSGTLTYEAVHQLSQVGAWSEYMYRNWRRSDYRYQLTDALKLFNEDDETDAIVMIGEIGGSAEEEAAEFIKQNMTKPWISFISGQTAPPGRRMGHAGAIIAGGKGTAAEKMKALQEAGVSVCKSPAEIGQVTKSVLA